MNWTIFYEGSSSQSFSRSHPGHRPPSCCSRFHASYPDLMCQSFVARLVPFGACKLFLSSFNIINILYCSIIIRATQFGDEQSRPWSTGPKIDIVRLLFLREEYHARLLVLSFRLSPDGSACHHRVGPIGRGEVEPGCALQIVLRIEIWCTHSSYAFIVNVGIFWRPFSRHSYTSACLFVR
jgi:hypothetical protein